MSIDNGHNQSPKKKLSMSVECKAVDIEWDQVTIKTLIQHDELKEPQEKTILNCIDGSVKHGTFTSILGPSGSGKTTLLNFLAGRGGENLLMTGEIRVNSVPIKNINVIGNLLAFVQQDDILLATMSPREIFTFAANLRLDLPARKRADRVEQVIEELDLMRCANTKVGNSMIRGVSGGERKRTSIGVDLITNPSVIFLDEPTTGLDSITALNVLDILQRLARRGRNIVSTIHQPSSEIFEKFDNLLLLLRGNIIYQGAAAGALKYFAGVGFAPPKFTNPADFFLRIMSVDGILMEQSLFHKKIVSKAEAEITFQRRIVKLVDSYKASPMPVAVKHNISKIPLKNVKVYRAFWIMQLFLVFVRSWKNEIRDPINLRSRVVSILFFILLVNTFYFQMGYDQPDIQNRTGVLFLLTSMAGFTSITGSLGTCILHLSYLLPNLIVSQERSVFIRERRSGLYSAGAYFWGRCFSELPFILLYPLLMTAGTYWAVNLNQETMNKFIINVVFQIVTWLAGSSYGILLSTLLPRLEFGLVVVPALLVPFLVLTGFFVSENMIPFYLKPFAYLSLFKWGFQGTAINEFTDLKLTCFPRYCDPLATFDFKETMLECFMYLIIIIVVTRIIAYIALVLIGMPPRMKLMDVKKREISEYEEISVNEYL